jgi:hypothetical protein
MVLAISVLGVTAPEQLVAVVASWPPDTRVAVAVGTRLVLGVVFLLAASTCRFPAVIYGIGILALAAALLLMLLGEPRVDARHPRVVRPRCSRGCAHPLLCRASDAPAGPPLKRIGRTKGVFALGAYQASACRVYPPAALPERCSA